MEEMLLYYTFEQGRDQGRTEAFAEVVEWLRAPNGAKVTLSGIGTAYLIADQIEAKYLKGGEK